MIGETVQLAPTDSTESTTVATTHPGTVSNQPAAIECQGPATPTLAHTSVPLQPQSADSSAVAARQIATADVARAYHYSATSTQLSSNHIRAITFNYCAVREHPGGFRTGKKGWVTSKKYVGVGNAFIIGRVCRVVKGLYQVRWVDSQFQSNVENLTLSMVQRGNTNYSALHGHATGPGWGSLCAVDLGERDGNTPGRISPTLWWIERPSYPRTVSLETSAKISTTARSAEVGDSGDARDVRGATSNASSDSGPSFWCLRGCGGWLRGSWCPLDPGAVERLATRDVGCVSGVWRLRGFDWQQVVAGDEVIDGAHVLSVMLWLFAGPELCRCSSRESWNSTKRMKLSHDSWGASLDRREEIGREA
ncbi:hypothetical protein GQ600_24583 [Phytophthora cactorum]|nr:hypothetical protein GQ600_24583 [Phytophthora cactorum]